jgi:signal transduction histidine kinase
VYTVEAPLTALINYLELASENPVDQKTLNILSKAQEASNSLINTVDNLLQLTDAGEHSNNPKSETFNLKLTSKLSYS